jgi:hypothetical protein
MSGHQFLRREMLRAMGIGGAAAAALPVMAKPAAKWSLPLAADTTSAVAANATSSRERIRAAGRTSIPYRRRHLTPHLRTYKIGDARRGHLMRYRLFDRTGYGFPRRS